MKKVVWVMVLLTMLTATAWAETGPGPEMIPTEMNYTFAIMFLRGGGNVFSLQEMMGHTDLTMTRRYVALAESDIKEQHEIASPVARLVPPKGRVGRIKKRK